MNNNVYISEKTLSRLAERAMGFHDTPESVIIRLLNNLDDGEKFKPELQFIPNEQEFKMQLVKYKKAVVNIIYVDGSNKRVIWNANRFNNDSNLKANIWSGYLRDWKKKGIIKAEFSIMK